MDPQEYPNTQEVGRLPFEVTYGLDAEVPTKFIGLPTIDLPDPEDRVPKENFRAMRTSLPSQSLGEEFLQQYPLTQDNYHGTFGSSSTLPVDLRASAEADRSRSRSRSRLQAQGEEVGDSEVTPLDSDESGGSDEEPLNPLESRTQLDLPSPIPFPPELPYWRKRIFSLGRDHTLENPIHMPTESWNEIKPWVVPTYYVLGKVDNQKNDVVKETYRCRFYAKAEQESRANSSFPERGGSAQRGGGGDSSQYSDLAQHGGDSAQRGRGRRPKRKRTIRTNNCKSRIFVRYHPDGRCELWGNGQVHSHDNRKDMDRTKIADGFREWIKSQLRNQRTPKQIKDLLRGRKGNPAIRKTLQDCGAISITTQTIKNIRNAMRKENPGKFNVIEVPRSTDQNANEGSQLADVDN
ncbi:hypothetical protein F4804DRAFT_183488 [Jackrogersella minutella]|nr:hypothetical protein F4804DRAFT_183488 [Jackrogersella minutella]